MINRFTRIAAPALGIFASSGIASAAILYSQDFQVDDTANWTTNDGGTTDIAVDYFYDYSAIGVPSAPNGSGTTGLKMTANNSTGVFGGFSVSPNGQSFSGEYRVSFDVWSNYVGPVGPGGSGTTQLSTYGLGTSGTTAVWPAASPQNQIMFATTLDGGSSSDFRVYSSAAPTSYISGDPVYSAPSRNGSDPYYAVFGGESAPAAQVLAYPGQTGTTDAGETAFKWYRVDLSVSGNSVTWEMDGTLLATLDASTVTLSGGNIFFGHSDTNSGSSSDPNDFLLNVTLVDNVLVESIPEPSAGLLALLGAALAFGRRRRS